MLTGESVRTRLTLPLANLGNCLWFPRRRRPIILVIQKYPLLIDFFYEKRKNFIRNIYIKKCRTQYTKLPLFAGSRRDHGWHPYPQFTKNSLLCIAIRSSYLTGHHVQFLSSKTQQHSFNIISSIIDCLITISGVKNSIRMLSIQPPRNSTPIYHCKP